MRYAVCMTVVCFFFWSWNNVFATLPLNTDEADTQDPGTLQVEVGVTYETDPACDHFDVPISLTYGLRPRMDFAVGIGGTIGRAYFNRLQE